MNLPIIFSIDDDLPGIAGDHHVTLRAHFRNEYLGS